MKPPREVLVPSASLMAAGPLRAPARAKNSIGVGSGENVLVSCIIIAITNFFAKSLSHLSQVLEQFTEMRAVCGSSQLCARCKPASA